MIPFAGLGAKIAASAAFGSAKDIATSIPKPVWYVLIALMCLGLGTCAHNNAKDKFEKTVRADERRVLVEEFNRKTQRIAQKAEALAHDSNELRNLINAKHGKIFAADVSSLDSHARDLLLRGPRSTQCPGGSAANRGVPGVPGSANPQGPVARGNAQVAGPGVWVRWFDLVERSKLCDIDQRALRRWETWHYEQSEADRIWRDKVGKEFEASHSLTH